MRFKQITGRICLLGLICWASSAAYAAQSYCAADSGGPLRVRNVSPVGQLYGVPRMFGGCTLSGPMEASFNFELVNNFQSESAAGTFGFFDGETYLTSYRFRGQWAQRFEWSVELPYISHAGGRLDGLINDFHEVLGLPDGDRDLAANGQLDLFVGSAGRVYADVDSPTSGLGDVRVGLSYQLLDGNDSALALRSQLKLPTGEVERLSGSEGTDLSVWTEYERYLAVGEKPWRLSLGVGGTYLGDGDLIPRAQENVVLSGHVGLRIPMLNRLDLIAQADAHTAYLDTGNPLVADGGVIGTIGARVIVTPQFWLDLAIIEDLDDKSASDVAFQILLGARL